MLLRWEGGAHAQTDAILIDLANDLTDRLLPQ